MLGRYRFLKSVSVLVFSVFQKSVGFSVSVLRNISISISVRFFFFIYLFVNLQAGGCFFKYQIQGPFIKYVTLQGGLRKCDSL